MKRGLQQKIGWVMCLLFGFGIVGIVVAERGWVGILILLGSIGAGAFFVTGLAWAMGHDVKDLLR